MSKIIYEKIKRKPQQFVKIISIDSENLSISIPKHWHRSIEIIYPKNGYSDIWLNGKIHTIKTGDFFVINSQEIHTFFGNDSKYKGYAIQIDLNFIKSMYPIIDTITFINDYTHIVNQKITEILEKIISISPSDTSEIETNGYALVLLSQLVQSSQVNDYKIDPQKSKYRSLVLEIMAYIDSHYSSKLSPQNLAKQYNLSYGYFSRIFKESTGITISEYIKYQRLEKALNDLKFSKLNLIEIALNNGFSDYKSFDKMFNERYKMKPSTFRKTIHS